MLKRRKLRIKKPQKQKATNKGEMPIFFSWNAKDNFTELTKSLSPKYPFLLHPDDFVHYLG